MTNCFWTSLPGEYELSRNVLGLGDEQLAAIARASLLASAAPRAVVGKGLASIDAWPDESGTTAPIATIERASKLT
jgi:adenosine deaminase